ncbi:hypothetical protein ACN38_g5652 [Penicillium nordicum]|uniref:Uncharacterized protein n=1 Tax=Penicillium nordicum TaxID=229535 RepID=A0A0M9WG53_9EURO|nr:hypothetical protein ACN38_g5652 [Penicillium nordicum]
MAIEYDLEKTAEEQPPFSINEVFVITHHLVAGCDILLLGAWIECLRHTDPHDDRSITIHGSIDSLSFSLSLFLLFVSIIKNLFTCMPLALPYKYSPTLKLAAKKSANFLQIQFRSSSDPVQI